jgi:putative SOS response-associated peptidase YedK
VHDAKYANEIRKKTFNAKAETIAEKPSFRHLIKSGKCMVLTSGFYEWQARGKEKQPYFIRVRNIESFALAGLYDTWTDRDSGEVLKTFTVITTAANSLMEKIHNTKKRMPVILSLQHETLWIDPDLPLEKTLSFLKPFDEKEMIAEEVGKEIFGVRKANEQGLLF